MLKDIEHRIAWEMYRISRVIDTGNFHVLLEHNMTQYVNMLYEIPVCCKINLEGQEPPLHIKITGYEKDDHFVVYTSYKDIEPTAESLDVQAYVPL